MVRSLWKGPFVDSYLIKKIPTSIVAMLSKVNLNNAKSSSRGVIKVWSRRSFILPEFINKFFEVHNGKQFISLQVNEDMVGHKFGEFASTRKKTLHKKKQKA
jgi:small subunit ribosomal protein S19